ncbi:MAG TPA: TatD family hydrolase [Vicinamibacteria bacterium]|nr:TatD family hydrolase [Vicinamibacteria bacterium]
MNDWLVDTHAHLTASEFDSDRDTVLSRARAAGVGFVLAVSETLEDAKANLALAAVHPDMVRPLAGLHPEYPDTAQARQLVEWIREHRQQLAGIGEVGLDYWRVEDEDARQRQRASFESFIDLSLELDLPLNVHSRSAGERTVACLLERGARRVQLHAFDGRASKAMPAVEAGYYFSVPPSIVRSPQKQKLVKRLPLRCLLLETDSPVLGPVPGERNEPANLVISLRAIAEIKGIHEEEVRSAVVGNTRQLWGLPARNE